MNASMLLSKSGLLEIINNLIILQKHNLTVIAKNSSITV